MPDRFDKPWGSRAEVEAAWRAGWDIESGPPPFTHALPPPVDDDLGHNGVAATDARPLFHNDLLPGHSAEELATAKAIAEREHSDALRAKGQDQ
jgi:hypothetical protein